MQRITDVDLESHPPIPDGRDCKMNIANWLLRLPRSMLAELGNDRSSGMESNTSTQR
ncbi:hypothetical protein Mal15_51810 [Stieleria maiorica]|uniref:Uncharacterized protein n=1 Tax=Stieleria maiorica TaxID=2795974 RepID=A0A5B9MN63_9BACT|nr:hypothetical protein Mal15_51810 [Stieleria maiorica]